MDAIKEQLQKPLVIGAGAFLIGLLVGWLALGWGLFPVEYVDGDPSQLAAAYQQDYVKAASDSYLVTGDSEQAKQRFGYLKDQAQPALEAAKAGAASENELFRLESFEEITKAPSPADGGEPGTEPTEPAATDGGGLMATVTGLAKFILPACGIFLFLGLVIGGVLFLRTRAGKPRAPAPPRTPAAAAQQASATTVRTDYTQEASPTGEQPIAQFMTTYMLGDDLYDDSFSVDAPSGDFLGECGVGISETIGVGDPKKVTAFEIWLFDKNDIRTVTRVLMSEHAFRDEALKARLSAKGEPVLAAPGEILNLQTETLLVTARVVDLTYGGGALPPSSFFDRITIELSAFQRKKA